MSLNKTISLSTVYLKEIISVVASYGVDIRTWFRSLGLVIPDEDSKMIFLTSYQFQQLIISSKALTKSSVLSFQVGQRLFINSHGMLGYALMSSANLNQLCQSLEEFITLRTNLFSLKLKIVFSEFRIIINVVEELFDARRWVLDTCLIALKNIYEFTTMGEIPIKYVSFEYPIPDHQDSIKAFVKNEVVFDAEWTGISFDIKFINKPLRMANATSFVEATKICREELSIKGQGSLSERVRELLINSIGNIPSLEVTTSNFNLTARTFHRRLVEEGLSYKEILKDTRHTLAKKYLRYSNMSVENISYVLGYNNASNFRRAFKTWQGVTPSQYLKQYKLSKL